MADPFADPFAPAPAMSSGARWWWASTSGAFALAVSYAFGGLGGVLLLLVVVSAGTATVLPLRLPRARRPRRRPPRVTAHGDAPFPDYRKVVESLSWAAVSPRHYDVVTRPVLQRLAAGRLAERHGLDLVRDHERARALLGEDVWPLVDPHRPARDVSAPPGVDLASVQRVVERVEAL
jgi:hypothetical protein